MKKILCGAIISIIGAIYSIALIVMATINDVYYNGENGLWGLLQGYGAVLPLMVSLIVVLAGIVICIYGAFKKDK